MTGIGPVFLDTSVLLPALIDMGPTHDAAQQLWDALVAGRLRRASTAWHCCLEFFAVATRLPEELRLSPEDVLVLLAEEVPALGTDRLCSRGGWRRPANRHRPDRGGEFGWTDGTECLPGGHALVPHKRVPAQPATLDKVSELGILNGAGLLAVFDVIPFHGLVAVELLVVDSGCV